MLKLRKCIAATLETKQGSLSRYDMTITLFCPSFHVVALILRGHSKMLNVKSLTYLNDRKQQSIIAKFCVDVSSDAIEKSFESLPYRSRSRSCCSKEMSSGAFIRT